MGHHLRIAIDVVVDIPPHVSATIYFGCANEFDGERRDFACRCNGALDHDYLGGRRCFRSYTF
jgi:hypothetical protein